MQHAQALHELQLDVEPAMEWLRWRPGRPRRDDAARAHRRYRIVGRILNPPPEWLEAERQRRATFVLIITLDDAVVTRGAGCWRISASTHGESRLQMLKDLMFVDALNLHTPRRVLMLEGLRADQRRPLAVGRAQV